MNKASYAGAHLKPWSKAWIKIRSKRHIIDMIRLATPIILSRLALSLLVVVDTRMVLRFSKEHNTWLTLGSGPADAFIGLAIGVCVGVPILVSRYYGAKDYQKIGLIWRQSLLWSFLTGIFITIACILSAPLFYKLGDNALASKAFPITVLYALSFIPVMIWLTASGLLEGTENPMPVLIFVVLGNVLNILFNWVLVYGVWIFPTMGAYGSALATLLVRSIMAIVAVYCILRIKNAGQYRITSWKIGKLSDWKELRVLGYAAALSIFIEASCFAFLNMFSTRPPLTDLDTAAWVVNLRILNSIFMVALGLSTATSVRVGIARGRKDFNDQIYALIIGTLLALFSLVFLSGLLILFAQNVATFFSKDVEIITYSAGFAIYLLWLFIPDGTQVTFAQSLRTSGVVWPTTMLAAIAYGLMAPLMSYYFAFPLGHGIRGLFEGLIAASWFICFAYFLLFVIYYKQMKIATEKEED